MTADDPQPDLAPILDAACAGDVAAAEELWRVVYQDLRVIAANQLRSLSPGQTLQPTALVNEAYLKLVGRDGRKEPSWQSRQHFFGASAKAMREILVDAFRRRSRLKRGGGQRPERLDASPSTTTGGGSRCIEVADSKGTEQLDLLELDDALKKLEEVAPRAAEVVVLRFFGGLTIDEAADAMDLSPATVDREWAYARAWLHREMGEDR